MRTAILAICLAAAPAFAQVSTDSHALDLLAPAPPKKPTPPARHRTPTPHPAATHSLPPTPMPAVAPANPVILPPTFTMPPHPPAPPPQIAFHADGPGKTSPLPGGTQITFGPGIADLNTATLAAIHTIADQAKANPAAIITITAYAPGTSDDPSTPRRLSLDRALAARAVLIQSGIVSNRIRATAKGFLEIGQSPPDRADIILQK